MTHRFAHRTLGVFAVLVLASCFGDTTGPGEYRMGRVAITPVFDARAIHAVDVNRARIRLVRIDGATALDTIVDFPASDTILQLPLTVPVTGAQETFDLYLRLYGRGDRRPVHPDGTDIADRGPGGRNQSIEVGRRSADA